MTMADGFTPDKEPSGEHQAAEVAALFSAPRLRLAREYRGLTQTALASVAGLSSAAISQFEKLDGSKPAPATTVALANALEFPLAFFAVQAAPSSRGSGGLDET